MNDFKRHYPQKLNNKRGSILLLTYFVIAILLGIGTTIFLISTNEGRIAERQRIAVTAFHVAEAGIERALYDLRQDFVNAGGVPNWSDCNINGLMIGGGCPSTVNYYNMPYGNVPFGEGQYHVDMKNNAIGPGEDVWVRSRGVVNDVTHEIEVYVGITNASPWGNAIFAGTGAGGAMINGNVDIRGSVHILGTGLDPGDFAVDLGGTAELVGNNYKPVSAALKAKVPALPTVDVGGEMVETLNAELRVKRGKVGLSGASTVGEANVAGNGEKETVDGVYVTDGWGGTSGSASVHSDNGFNNAYDLGDAVDFPSLADPIQGEANYRDYLVNVEGAYVASAADRAILQNVTPATNYTVGNCASNCISFDGTGNMTVNGIVVVDSVSGTTGLGMSKAGAQKTFEYTGTGAIYVNSDVQIDVNLMTQGNNSYPNNIVAIMTPEDIGFNLASIDVMGLFYAENQITVEKQTDIMGSIVSNYFDMGVNVPSIFQVPETVNFLPGGLIGGDAYWYLVVAWIKS